MNNASKPRVAYVQEEIGQENNIGRVIREHSHPLCTHPVVDFLMIILKSDNYVGVARPGVAVQLPTL